MQNILEHFFVAIELVGKKDIFQVEDKQTSFRELLENISKIYDSIKSTTSNIKG